MGVFIGAFPVLPGKEDQVRILAKEISGPRFEDFKVGQKEASLTGEAWALQETPAGTFLLVYLKGDIEKAFAHVATSDSEYETWFRSQVLDLCGVDLAQPPTGPGPETIFEYEA